MMEKVLVCLFRCFLKEPGSAFRIRIRIQKALEYTYPLLIRIWIQNTGMLSLNIITPVHHAWPHSTMYAMTAQF